MLRELGRAYGFYHDNQPEFWGAVLQHLQLSMTALAIALIMGVPLGIVAAKRPSVAQAIINLANALRVIPSLAILFVALPYFGLGFRPALIALTVLACPPILINTYAGFRTVDRAVIEAARGMGMAGAQVLRMIEAPLALPVIIAGVRIAAVEVIASASLAAFIAGGGLGIFIQRGFAVNQPSLMLAGTIPIAVLALAAEALLAALQRAVVLPGT